MSVKDRCPKCGRRAVVKDLRKCGACNAPLFFPGDQPIQVVKDNPFFMWLKGPKGEGWYRRPAIESLFNLKQSVA